MKSDSYHLTRVLHRDGERRVYLVDLRGLEEDYSALFLISSVRNAGLSVASQEAALNAINVLYRFCAEWKIDLAARFRAASYLSAAECQALSDFARRSFGAEHKKQQIALALGKGRRGYKYSLPAVKRQTHSSRLSHIAKFADWLAKYLLVQTGREHVDRIAEMSAAILRLRPISGSKHDDFDDKHFTAHDNVLLNEIIAPGGPRNPFADDVQLRNLLLIEILRQTGIRRGEALNVQVRDVDHVKREITIRRRHDSNEDPRINQPLVKTLGRVLPISIDLTDLIVNYVSVRRSVPGATKHRYLFVTHKSGPTQGQPMTKSAMNEVFKAIKAKDTRLSHLTPHQLRHLFNNELARHQLAEGSDPNRKEVHRRVRNCVAGRKATSEVDACYTAHETKRQARDAVLEVQAEMVPKFPLDTSEA